MRRARRSKQPTSACAIGWKPSRKRLGFVTPESRPGHGLAWLRMLQRGTQANARAKTRRSPYSAFAAKYAADTAQRQTRCTGFSGVLCLAHANVSRKIRGKHQQDAESSHGRAGSIRAALHVAIAAPIVLSLLMSVRHHSRPVGRQNDTSTTPYGACNFAIRCFRRFDNFPRSLVRSRKS